MIMDLMMFHRINRYNNMVKSTQESKSIYKDNITLEDLDKIDILDNQGLDGKEISNKLKINPNKIQHVLDMKHINKKNPNIKLLN